ncbi:hypothetical protein NK553_28395 [Pseudomonas sp. ZM23]|uniref:Uncharacterized protein n=1 Tax=Pseudomonas triclosanedens TaxID=2961893 RepID=A0ABY6ZVG3_9PSED|nr:hypothetical protein [Pseudomonas triclosanedens]MCP8467876.1 hypothetical protein [Pseudomonas triclosanedens]MCP8473848.1 hypothetical protein [Pseudomonas triclosanedens]MCP8479826.1 hypothetical protein [Pseudomonas triclosanedens]WAI48766.1 hypothetical protein OU419_23890 [Pseudomonas triclosanedens]
MTGRSAVIACLAGWFLCLPVQAMKALDDEQLGEVSGAGLGFFIDGFSYDQSSATAKITGVKNSANQDVQVDITGAYIKGAGSQRGTLDTKAYLGTPMHPFTFGPIKYKTGDNIPVGQQALQLKTPTWTDPINDTHKFGLWSYYQGCLYGESGCTDPTLASNKVNTELTTLTGQRDTLLSTYQNNMPALKSGIDADMLTVNQRQAVVDQREALVQSANDSVNSAYNVMKGWYDQLPAQQCGPLGGSCQSRPAIGDTYSCPLIGGCKDPNVAKYNSSIKPWSDAKDSLSTAQNNLAQSQQDLSAAWSVTRNGVTLSKRASDYDKFIQLCGAQSGSGTTCVSGTIDRTSKNAATVKLVADAMPGSAGTRIQGLDIGIKTRFTLPSVAYNSNGTAGATTQRQDFFSISLENFTLNGSYLNLWGDKAGMKLSMSLQMYADKLVISGCETCSDSNRAVAKNVYFDLNLGDANYQPATLTVASNGDLVLNAPGVTWANHDAFYKNVQKSNISIGNLNIGGTDIGSQAIRGMRIDYLNVRTVNLPR